ncbi:MAG: SsrA-binding protein SmpB [Hyphomicrobiaceae bacterium]|nr:SsrA-binding protein SmpB [Hyphomicrobiaceae bacterium]
MAKKDEAFKPIAENRKARHEYFIEDTYVCGISLTGTEVKSLRLGLANITESYASPENGGIFLVNAHIPEYKQAGPFFQHAPRRPRQLLLKAKEIDKLQIAVAREGMTLIPLEIFFNEKGRAKLKLGLAKGKKLHDRREASAKRDWQRDKARLMRGKG